MLNKTTAAPENHRPWRWYRVGAPEEHLSGSVLLRSSTRVGAPEEPASVLLRSWLLRSRVGDSQERPSPTYPWVCLRAKGTVPYLGLGLDPRGVATMKEERVLRCEALLRWCKNTLGPASVPHEVMAAVVGGIVRYAAPYLSNTAEAVIKLNTAIKAAALQFEKLPKDLSNVAVRFGHGLRLADVQVICRDSVVATMAQLTHHRSTTVR